MTVAPPASPPRRDVASPVLRTAGLALMWAALWADLSVATLAAGALVAVGVQTIFPTLAPRRFGRVRVLALAKLGVVFAGMLVRANLFVLWRVIAPRVSLSPRVVDVALPPCTDAVATAVANAVTLTPGTLTLDVTRTPDAVILTVHALDATDPEPVVASVRGLYDLAAAAFPSGAAGAGGHRTAEQEERA